MAEEAVDVVEKYAVILIVAVVVVVLSGAIW